MGTITNKLDANARIIHCPDCKGLGFSDRAPTDTEIFSGGYFPSEVVSEDCPTCRGVGEMEECSSCKDLSYYDKNDSLLDSAGICFTCAMSWEPRTAVVWSVDIDGMNFYYYTEKSPNQWVSTAVQYERSSEVHPVAPRTVSTDKLTWCADGGVIISADGTFTGIET